MKRHLFTITLFSLFIMNQLFGLNFQVSELISIPGNNRNFHILEEDEFGSAKYICWENQNDSVYTIFLKQIDINLSENIVVYSDITPNINPQISSNRFDQGIKIVWQSEVNNHWQLLLRNFHNDSLSQIISVTDSLSDNIDPSLSIHRVAYINSGKLLVKAFYPECEGYYKPVVVDSGFCSNPDIRACDSYVYTSIIYENCAENQKQIYEAGYRYNVSEGNYTWTLDQLSDGVNNINPRYGYYDYISYQTFIDNLWKIKSIDYPYYTSNNKTCNFYNPFCFCYPIVAKKTIDYTPFFIAFDSDSVTENQEIFIKIPLSYLFQEDTILNVSNALGFDEKPCVTIINDSVTIVWEHTENSKTDIWWAKAQFNPYPGGGIDNPISNEPCSFTLSPNYPNPFNPSTVISFQVNRIESKKAVIKIYNSIGELVRTISKDTNGTGNYLIIWDGKSDTGRFLPTGNYLYSIFYGNITRSGKMCLIK